MDEDLDKYAIVVAEMKNSKNLKLRALLDLRNHKFEEGQKFGVVGSFNEAYKNV